MSTILRRFKRAVRRALPRPLSRLYSQLALRRLRAANASLTCRDVFTRVYDGGEWGGQPGQFCSGAGSNERQAEAYGDMVTRFIRDKGIATVVDLGCGDFTVGAELQEEGVRYIGVDIVEGLIEHNQQTYGTVDTSFECLDIVADPLPAGDLCLIRQVLQHLSNDEIVAVLDKVKQFKYVLISEHYPAASVRARPNVDKPHGPDIRIYDDSAVYLDQPPFNVPNPVLVLEVDVSHDLVAPGEKIRTYLITH